MQGMHELLVKLSIQSLLMCLNVVFLRRPPPVPVSESQKSSFSASQQSTNQSTEFPNEAQGEFEIQTNPDLPSPARVRWIDAVSRVCAHLSSTVTIVFL